MLIKKIKNKKIKRNQKIIIKQLIIKKLKH